jgi:hypothetical protein
MICKKLSDGTLINLDHVVKIPSAITIEKCRSAGKMVEITMAGGCSEKVAVQDAYNIWLYMSDIPWS